MLLADFAHTVLHGTPAAGGVPAQDSLGESLTAMAIYRAQDSKVWETVFVDSVSGVLSTAVLAVAEVLVARL